VAAIVDAGVAGIGIDAAITVAGPAGRLDDQRLETIGRTLVSTIAAFFGHDEPTQEQSSP
jgi:hypothetical protein